ncbi:SDR family NAD(P)-dependent oxidoreductase [Blastococcus sp. TF02A-26]|uniref:SDR family NAD(P)-dependent oxidoreductase n=1 Tax=Blastococcus sp. TF02A-26 TaxID=2250577 RepID=UPI000DE98331|nr:SDR family NAD(P)-dependent oxidoreductase [Blastococcus sp. TF02A-26]RBY84343.1 SDR family NAD(P)-dependent oxidoreductase [Blastococcus sp. TF02A-26]
MGAAIARLFAAEGARVAALDLDADGAARIAAEVGGSAHLADVSDPAAVGATVAAAAEAMGGIDGVVNAAGILLDRPAAETTPADVARLVGVNLAGPLYVCQAALPHLQAAERATVVNVASMAALRPVVGMAVYSATKAGLLAMSHALAYEWGPTIRVNTLCPGIIRTPMTEYLFDPAHPAYETIPGRHALGRAGEPEEVAAGALFLTSDESSFVSRTELAINGGTYR